VLGLGLYARRLPTSPPGTTQASYQPTWHHAAAVLPLVTAVAHLLLLELSSACAACVFWILEAHGLQGAGWVLVQYGVAAGQVYLRAVVLSSTPARCARPTGC
jgi:hypothetical protein